MTTALLEPLDFEPDHGSLVCPDPHCSCPATIELSWTFASTDGPVEMVKIRCAAGCWFTVPAADLPR